MSPSNSALCQNEQPFSLLLLGSSNSSVGQVSHSPGKTLLRFVCWFPVVAFCFFSKENQFMEGLKMCHCNCKSGHGWRETPLTRTRSLRGHLRHSPARNRAEWAPSFIPPSFLHLAPQPALSPLFPHLCCRGTTQSLRLADVCSLSNPFLWIDSG